ncbi:MAG: TonB-dependent receptor plug domain-containing protein, partial [Dysgonamonadaceae bacterium]|nr:TonB-dependent receptor plug domain-containing protein [Dysgonamonadaceae bacterium]
MRLVILFLTIGMGISYAGNSYSQVTTLSLKLNNKTVREVFKEIEKNSEYIFLFNRETLNPNRVVSINVEKETINNVLDKLFEGTDNTYKVSDRQVYISKAEKPQQNVIAEPEQQQKRSISGTVVDQKGEAVIGANIVEKGTTNGTVTDIDGRFSLSVNNDAILQISYIGYLTQEISTDGKTAFNIVLKEQATMLEDMVVTALGIRRAEKALSYNVQEVNNKELTTVRSANFMNALAGKVAGVAINSSAAGPGAAVKVIMRGAKSLSKDNNALYVIDGIPMYNSSYGNGVSDGLYSTQPGSEGAADINPDDIESISLLTGPSAAALYGYEGANGVVMITTKKGNTNKTTLTVSNSTLFSNPMMMPKFQNTYGNRNGEVTSWGDATNYRYDPAKFFNTGSHASNSISLSTGNAKNQTYLSAATTNAQGILPGNAYNRYNFTFRNTASMLDDKLTLDA